MQLFQGQAKLEEQKAEAAAKAALQVIAATSIALQNTKNAKEQKEGGKLHLVTYVDENNRKKYAHHLAAFRCYAATHGYVFKILGKADELSVVSEAERKDTTTSKGERFYLSLKECDKRFENVFFRKHCAVASYLKNVVLENGDYEGQGKDDHVYVFDADVFIKLPPWMAQAEVHKAITGAGKRKDTKSTAASSIVEQAKLEAAAEEGRAKTWSKSSIEQRVIGVSAAGAKNDPHQAETDEEAADKKALAKADVDVEDEATSAASMNNHWWHSREADLTFYKRNWNNEVMAGNYAARPTRNAVSFLKRWANFEYHKPTGFSSSDQGALPVLLIKTLILDPMDQDKSESTAGADKSGAGVTSGAQMQKSLGSGSEAASNSQQLSHYLSMANKMHGAQCTEKYKNLHGTVMDMDSFWAFVECS